MTIRHLATLTALLGAAACATRGAPELAPLPVASLRTTPGALGDSLRQFYDSLGDRRPATITLAGDTSSAVAWATLLQDDTLRALVREALGNNPDLQIARARIREFRAEAAKERGGLLPEVSVNGSASTNQTVFGSLGTFGFDAYRVTADLTWELDFWGRIRGNVRAATADLDARGEDVRATVLSLVADVAQGYLDLRALDQNMAVAKRTLDSRRQTLALAQRRLDEGLISELDVRQFEAQVAQPAARVAEFSLAIARGEHRLAELVGRGPGPISRGKPLAEVAGEIALPDSVDAALVSRRPDVMRAGYELDAAAARAGAKRAARLPSFFVTGQYGSQGERPGNLFKGSSEIYTIQGGVSIPLFDNGRRAAEARAESAREEQARIRHEAVVLAALREVSDALVAVRTSRDQLAAQEVQVRALRRALELAQRRYDNGVSSYLEVLDSQRSLFEAELALTSAEQSHLASGVQLYKALGGSWEP